MADEYHGFGDAANFRDFDLLVGGQVVPAVSSAFDYFWNSGWSFPAQVVEPEARRNETALAVLRANLAQREIVLEPWLQIHDADYHD